MSGKAVELVKKFWELMGTNDFRSVGSLLADDFVLDWPQSNERIRGRENFARMNEEYPANGRWEFTVNRIVGNDIEAVSDVSGYRWRSEGQSHFVLDGKRRKDREAG